MISRPDPRAGRVTPGRARRLQRGAEESAGDAEEVRVEELEYARLDGYLSIYFCHSYLLRVLLSCSSPPR